MERQHELIVPREGMPFKMFAFEGGGGNYVRKPHWHNSIEIFAVFSGALNFYFGERRRRIAGGSFVIVDSNELHSIHAPRENDTVVLQIPLRQFAPYFTAEHYIAFRQSAAEWDKKVMELVREMFGLLQRRPAGYEYDALCAYYQLLAILVRSYRREEPDVQKVRSSKALRRLSPITEYIKENYSSSLTLQSLAGQFGYSPEHLSRLFRQYAHINYKDYLTGIRLEHAKEEIQKGERTMGDIAVAVGFSDSRAMAKAFRRQYGMLPSEFARQKISKK